MKRLIAAAALAAALTTGVGQAVAGNHSGPEANAKGTGEAAVNTTVGTPIIREVCFSFVFCFTTQVGTTTVATTQAESFDFDAKAGPQTLTPLDPIDGPHGTMKVSIQSSTTTTVSTFPICRDPFYTVTGGCPPPSTNTTSQSSTATAEVTCLQVVNNRAAIGGHVIRYDGTAAPTRGLLFNVTDNTIAGLQPAPDQFSAAFVADAPQVCPAPTADHPITKGDIFVDQS